LFPYFHNHRSGHCCFPLLFGLHVILPAIEAGIGAGSSVHCCSTRGELSDEEWWIESRSRTCMSAAVLYGSNTARTDLQSHCLYLYFILRSPTLEIWFWDKLRWQILSSSIQIRNRVRTLPCTPFEYAIYTVTCMGDYRRGLDW
jgi:hypothetical protein